VALGGSLDGLYFASLPSSENELNPARTIERAAFCRIGAFLVAPFDFKFEAQQMKIGIQRIAGAA
jgi:hypothetical protein